MSNTVLREELLQSFQHLQGRFDQALNDAKQQEEEFDTLRNRFIRNLSARLKDAREQLPPENPLSTQVNGLINLLNETNLHWNEKAANRDRGIGFRKNFEDSLLIFVYGKVKSGKSSLEPVQNLYD